MTTGPIESYSFEVKSGITAHKSKDPQGETKIEKLVLDAAAKNFNNSKIKMDPTIFDEPIPQFSLENYIGTHHFRPLSMKNAAT